MDSKQKHMSVICASGQYYFQITDERLTCNINHMPRGK